MTTGGSPFHSSNAPWMSVLSTRNSTSFLKGEYTLTADEMAGYQLFKRQGQLQFLPR